MAPIDQLDPNRARRRRDDAIHDLVDLMAFAAIVVVLWLCGWV
jgi:hypothetical protein